MMMQGPQPREGVVKYRAEHVRRALTAPPEFPELLRWRQQLFARHLIGADADGLGYGNLSIRLYSSPRFLITGSQTSGREQVDPRHFAEVVVADLERNFLRCVGEIQASSEALTHAALYASDVEVRAVVHVHSRAIWSRERDRLPTTRADVEYGTPEMAHEMIRLHRRGPRAHTGVIVMAGHEDGVIAFGTSIAQAARAILDLDGDLPPPSVSR